MRAIPILLAGLLLVGCTAAAAPTPPPTAPPTEPADTTACGASNPSGYEGWSPPAPQPSGQTLVPVIVSSQNVVGPDRFLFTVLDGANKLIAAPDVATDVRLFALSRDPANPATTAEGVFMDLGLDRGLYRASEI